MSKSRTDLNEAKKKLCESTNKNNVQGQLTDAIIGKDVFIGVSQPRIVTEKMIKTMKKDPIIFAMSNPEPEILPDLAKKAGAAVVGTGRSDYPNQVNNLLAFPGVFRGALDIRAKRITSEMKVAAAKAIAASVDDENLGVDKIIPSIFDRNVETNVAEAVAKAWIDEQKSR